MCLSEILDLPPVIFWLFLLSRAAAPCLLPAYAAYISVTMREARRITSVALKRSSERESLQFEFRTIFLGPEG
jgi:cytochrome c biogenesis protein CcdA